MMNSERYVKMSDGTNLAYAEYGDPHGMPVMYFHGCPSSHIEGKLLNVGGYAHESHIRIIVPDRPGIGRSDFKPYTIVGWPDMVSEFADKIGVGTFSVMGTSSGGKYSAACAWKIPDRILNVFIISSESPIELPGAFKTLGYQDKIIYTIAKTAPWLLRMILWKMCFDLRRDSSGLVRQFFKSEPGKGAFMHEDVKMIYGKMLTEAFSQGVRGVLFDFMLEARPWGFPLHETRIPVSVWHGEVDRFVPIQQGRIIANAIPFANARFFPGEGHTLVVTQIEQLIRELTAEVRKKKPILAI